MDTSRISIDALSPPVAELARLGTEQKYSRKTLILREGDAGQELLVLLDGRLRIYTENQEKRRFVVGTFGPETIFGEGSLDGGPRTASVEAVTDATCSVVPYAVLIKHMMADATFATTLLMELVARSRVSMGRMKGLALDTIYQRLLTLIEAEATIVGGTRVLGPEWTQQELANRLGSSRDMITRIFRGLSEGGYIDASRSGIRIVKKLPSVW